MRNIPYLERLGDEFERVAREESSRKRVPGAARVVTALVGMAGAAALLLIWGPYHSPGQSSQTLPAVQAENQPKTPDVELLTTSFESIVAELDWVDVGAFGTEIGQAGGPYPRDILDSLGSDFNVLHVPTYLPTGYSLYGKVSAGGGFDRAPRIQTQVLNYDDWGFFIIDQFAQGFTPRAVEELAQNRMEQVEVEGFRLYVRRTDSEHVVYFFESNGVWFDIIVGMLMDAPGLGPGDVARTAMSLVGFGVSGWGDSQAVVPTVSVFGGASDENEGGASGAGRGRCSMVSRVSPVSPRQDTSLARLAVHSQERQLPRQGPQGQMAVHPGIYEHGRAFTHTVVEGPTFTHA